jgi:hypothetical protein
VDRKFVLLDCGGVLVALDQHAADERVRLEDLRDRVLADAAALSAGGEAAVGSGTPIALAHLSREPADAAPCFAVDSVGNDVADTVTSPVPLIKPAELLGSETIASSPAGGLNHRERHLYEAYRDQVERCVCCTWELRYVPGRLFELCHLIAAMRRWGWRADLSVAQRFEAVAVPRILDTLLTPTDLKVTAQTF